MPATFPHLHRRRDRRDARRPGLFGAVIAGARDNGEQLVQRHRPGRRRSGNQDRATKSRAAARTGRSGRYRHGPHADIAAVRRRSASWR